MCTTLLADSREVKGRNKSQLPLSHLLCWLVFAFWLPTSLADEVHWQGAWVRAMPPSAKVTAAYGLIINETNGPIHITDITSSISSNVQIHTVIKNGDQRRMTQLESITLKSGETLSFTPGGLHIMLSEITEGVAEQMQVRLCIHYASDETCTLAPILRKPIAKETTKIHPH